MLIEIQHASLTYQADDGEVEALRDISLEMEEGELCSIVGPSGCGKSTLLGAIAGLERLDGGSITLDGEPVTGPSPRIGLMPQRDQLFEWRTILDTNLSSVFYCCRAVIPMMLKNGQGKIINISSIWGIHGASCEVAYSATKGAVNSFTKALAKELAPSNIQVNAVSFGFIDTDMNAKLSPEEIQDFADSYIPAGRIATAEEAAEFISTVATAGSYCTGQLLGFDGGY